MNRNDEIKEMFAMHLEHLEHEFRTKATVSTHGIWVSIEFGKLATVGGRGYLNAMRALNAELDKLVE